MQSVTQWLSDWLTLRSAELAPRTLDCYRATIRLHIAPSFNGVELAELRPEQIASMLAAICAAGHTRTAILCHAILSRSLADAARYNLLPRNPMADVPRPAHRPARASWLSPEELSLYLAAVAADRNRLAWLLALCCGLRRGEICGLRWQDVNFRENVLHIRNQRQRLDNGCLVDREPKSESGIRDIPIPANVLPLLRSARQLAGYVVLSSRGQPFTPSGLDQAHARLLASAGLRHVRLHDIRHTMGAVAIRQQVPIKTLQVLLGHSHYSTTADIYAHVDLSAARCAIDQITASMV